MCILLLHIFFSKFTYFIEEVDPSYAPTFTLIVLLDKHEYKFSSEKMSYTCIMS